jgi:methylenetetrahydrofolate reductase (NADPH)
MNTSLIHPNWDLPYTLITDGYSIEMTAKDLDALHEAGPHIPKETPVAVTFLPGEALEARVAAIKAVRAYGCEPMPHFSARRIGSEEEFEVYVKRSVQEGDVRRCFVVAGDPPQAEGPYSDSSSLIETGLFEKHGMKAIGIGGHPEGHPNMTDEECWQVLEKKCNEIDKRGMAPLIVTQFAFDAEAVLNWLKELRNRGIDVPVRIGVPGPAGIKTLIKFASRCGVGASASVMKKYGVSITKLVGSAGPDKLVDEFNKGIGTEHGKVRLHFYPFGGLKRSLDWIGQYEKAHTV